VDVPIEPLPVPAPAPAPAPDPAPPAPAPAIAAVAPARADKLVAVLDLRGGAAAHALTTVLTAEVGARDGYDAVSRNELRALLAHQAEASELGCEELGCVANVGRLAKAELVISGAVEDVEGGRLVSLSLIDPVGPRIVERQELVFRGPVEELLAVARPAVDRLLAGPNAATHTGALEVIAPAGALVVVDGRDVGTAPLDQPIANLAVGVHRLRVTKDGARPYDGDVVIAWNETTIARPELVETPLHEQAWFWPAAAGVALVAVGTVVGITTFAILNDDAPARVVLGAKP
jgi:hypothetical protein